VSFSKRKMRSVSISRAFDISSNGWKGIFVQHVIFWMPRFGQRSTGEGCKTSIRVRLEKTATFSGGLDGESQCFLTECCRKVRTHCTILPSGTPQAFDPRLPALCPGRKSPFLAVKRPSRPKRPHKSHRTKRIHYGERRTLRACNCPGRARTELEGAELERQLRKLLSLCRTSVSCSPIISATSAAFGSSWSNAESICPRPSGVPFSVIQYDVHFQGA
jgi:hypothetical protein